jgi:hypothetical protein
MALTLAAAAGFDDAQKRSCGENLAFSKSGVIIKLEIFQTKKTKLLI